MYIIFGKGPARQNEVVDPIQHLNWLSYLFRGLHEWMRYVSSVLKDPWRSLSGPLIFCSLNSTTSLEKALTHCLALYTINPTIVNVINNLTYTEGHCERSEAISRDCHVASLLAMTTFFRRSL